MGLVLHRCIVLLFMDGNTNDINSLYRRRRFESSSAHHLE
jgi:hypothetical protein